MLNESSVCEWSVLADWKFECQRQTEKIAKSANMQMLIKVQEFYNVPLPWSPPQWFVGFRTRKQPYWLFQLFHFRSDCGKENEAITLQGIVKEGYYPYKRNPNLQVHYGFPKNGHTQAIYINFNHWYLIKMIFLNLPYICGGEESQKMYY